MKRSSKRQDISGMIMIALIVIFGLQLIRVLLPTLVYYLRDAKGMSAITLAPIALGIFAISFLVAPLCKLIGQRRALLLSAGGVALLRAVEQLIVDPTLDLVLVSLGVALFAMFPAIMLEVIRSSGAKGTYEFGLAFLLGVAADTAIHSGASTWDLSWREEPLVAALVVSLAVVDLVLLWRRAKAIDPALKTGGGWSRVLAIAALGPWLFLQLVVFQNVARMAAITGWSLPAAGLFVGIGNVIALISAAHAQRSKRVPGLAILVAAVFFAVLLFIENDGILGALLSIIGQVLGASLLLMILVTLGWFAQNTGRMGVSAANGIGQLLFVIFMFIFYISYEIDFGFRSEAILPVAGLLISVSAVAVSYGFVSRRRVPNDHVPAYMAAGLLLIPFILLLTWNTPEPEEPADSNISVRVMDYNLHNGFNTDGRLNLEALAQAIENSEADVVGLQEVSRGWVVNGSADMLQWLSQRLDMPYAYEPTEGFQWGIAILSRYPIGSVETGSLPPDSLRFRRGYIKADIQAGRDTLRVLNTHLHHIEEDSETRQEQVPLLIDTWNGAPRTVLMGDFNASPDSPEMVMLAAAGLIDVGGSIGPDPGYTYYSADPYQRIDYFWTSPDLVPASYEIQQTTASDHLPLATTILMP
jgi:endonuclease/exonuclease/phosphatase family metal-dependent hydrolase